MLCRALLPAMMLAGASAFFITPVRVGGGVARAASPAMQASSADMDAVIQKLQGLSLLEASELVKRIEELFENPVQLAGSEDGEAAEGGDAEEAAKAEDSE
mmetsp:Transcript_34498/g.111350  ORF Transcript_34498/g.111350 Transcript_34498/m.111350 type:complete len:101 (+) Transcript_34498:70-372(+)